MMDYRPIEVAKQLRILLADATERHHPEDWLVSTIREISAMQQSYVDDLSDSDNTDDD